MHVPVAAGTRWFRIVGAKNPTQAERFVCTPNPTRSEARFSPIFDAAGAVIPSAYAAATARIALWEVVLRDARHKGVKNVPHSALAGRYLFEVQLLDSAVFVNLERPVIQQLALPGERAPDLTPVWPSGYKVTGQWAQMLHEEAAGAQGLFYESHQVPGQCFVLYQAHSADVFAVVDALGPMSQGKPRRWLIEEAQKAGITVDFDDPDADDDS